MSSQLRAFEDTLLNIRDLRELQGSFELFVKESNIRLEDKKKLIMNIRFCDSINRLHKLFYNSLLKFEGMPSY